MTPELLTGNPSEKHWKSAVVRDEGRAEAVGEHKA
jgi:hypothetical protein